MELRLLLLPSECSLSSEKRVAKKDETKIQLLCANSTDPSHFISFSTLKSAASSETFSSDPKSISLHCLPLRLLFHSFDWNAFSSPKAEGKVGIQIPEMDGRIIANNWIAINWTRLCANKFFCSFASLPPFPSVRISLRLISFCNELFINKLVYRKEVFSQIFCCSLAFVLGNLFTFHSKVVRSFQAKRRSGRGSFVIALDEQLCVQCFHLIDDVELMIAFT